MTDGKKVTVSFRRDPSYRIIPATGAWGGPTPDGSILMNLMVEHGAMPSYQTYIADEQGRINPQKADESVSSGDGERDVLVGVLMSPRTARRLAEWLIHHADKIESKSDE